MSTTIHKRKSPYSSHSLSIKMSTENTKLVVIGPSKAASSSNNNTDNNNNNTSFAGSATSSTTKGGSHTARAVRDYSNTYRQFFGTNILQFAWIIMILGVVVGPIATVFVAVLEYRAILSLLRVKYHYADSSKLVAFGQIGERTLGNCGGWLVDTCVILCQWLGCVGYATFSGHNFEKVSGIDYKYCVIISVAVSLLVSFAQHPFFLAKLSLFTNAVMFAGVGVIFSQLRFGEEASKRGDMVLWTDPLHTMIGLTALATSLGGITVTLDVERTMAHSPGRYHMILRRMIIFAVVMLDAIGLMSYAAFRADTCGVLSLSLNEGTPRKIAEVLLVVGPAFESVLNSFQMFVIMSDRMKRFPQYFNPEGSVLQWVTLRVVAFVAAAAVAIGVPFYALITGVNGAVGYGALAFLVPPAMELRIIWQMENGVDTQQVATSNNNNNNAAVPNNNTLVVDTNTTNNGNEENDDVRLYNTTISPRNSVSESENKVQGTSMQFRGTSNPSFTEGLPPGQAAAMSENNSAVDEEEDVSVDENTLALAQQDAVCPSRKWELLAILILGGALIGCGLYAAIRDIVEQEEGKVKKGC